MGQSVNDNACTHCGLVAPTGDTFCCYGCELAHALVADDDGVRHRTVARLTVSLLLAMMVMMLSLFLYAEDVYEATSEPLYVWFRQITTWVSAVLATLVVALLGPPLVARAARAARTRRLTMELLIAVAAGAAWAVSMVSVLRGTTTVYFDSAVAALVLATFGRTIEAQARAKAGGIIGPLLEPSAKPVMAGVNEMLSLTDPKAIRPGMHVEVPAGSIVPVDLRATAEAEVSLAVLNGESDPVVVHAGDEVLAGAAVLSVALPGRVLRDAEHSALAQLERMTRSLRSRRSPVLRSADRLASWLAPVVAVVAIASLAWWTRARGLDVGVEVALAVVLVACPCTYGVITPLISWLSLRKALENDVCIRDAAVIEALANVQSVAFDKTGTVTQPLAAVALDVAAGVSETEAMALARALERDLPHPVARAIYAMAGTEAAPLEQVTIAPRGVRGLTTDGDSVAIGAPVWLEQQAVLVPPKWRGREAVLSREGEAIAAFAVGERVVDDAEIALARLHDLGLPTILMSGDRASRVKPVAAHLGMTRWASDLLPEDKVASLRRLSRPAFVGDGLNDAPASAAALVGFAVDGATSLNRGIADVVLLSGHLCHVPWVLGLGRRALRLSRQTLAVATLYNVLFVVLAATGHLRPVWAGLSMLLASVIALAGALRMSSYRGPEESLAPDLKLAEATT